MFLKEPEAFYKLHLKLGKNILLASFVDSKEIASAVNSITRNGYGDKPVDNLNFLPLRFFKFEGALTITEFIDNFCKYEKSSPFKSLACQTNDTNETFSSDLVNINKFKLT